MSVLTAPRLGPAVGRRVGTAAGSALALALLACGCVFAALAGPALSLHTRTQALQQTLAGFPSTTRTVQVDAAWSDFVGSLPDAKALSQDRLTQATDQIGLGLKAAPLPLGAGQWAAVTTKSLIVTAGAAPSAQAGQPPKLEVSYRVPSAGNLRVVAGSLAGGSAPPGTVAVAATVPTAARFGLRPGSRLSLETPNGLATIVVTAVVRVRDAGSTFWQQDTTLVRPSLEQVKLTTPPFWQGGVIADPDQLAAVQRVFGADGLALHWEYPLDLTNVNADQARGLYQSLNRTTTAAPQLTGDLTAGEGALAVSSPLLPDLALFISTQAAVETVLLLLFVSLTVVGTAVILLAARMIVARREAELTLLRARGGSVGQVAARVLGGAVLSAGPGIVVGAGLAIALVPAGGSTPGNWAPVGWPLAAIAAAAALAGPSLIAAWQYRKPAPASNPARITTAETRRTMRSTGPARPWRRLVIEVTAIAASVAGLVVLHDQGVPAGGSGSPGASGGLAGGADLYLTVAPVLVAIPVVVIMLRLYPLVVRGLAALSARRTGATGFVALSLASRSPLTGALPAFALVLALSVATFAGMVSQGIVRGEITASWQTTGAEVLIAPGPASPAVSPAAVKAIAAVPGVRAATEVWNTNWFTPFGQPVTVTAVDPASYAAVTAGTPFPAFPAGLIGKAAPTSVVPDGATIPVLASAAAAAVLGKAPVQLSTLGAIGPLKVRVAGILPATPALPSGGSYVVMPLRTLAGPTGAPAPNLLLVSGSAINHARLTAVAGRVIPGGIVTFRTQILAELESSPLQHGAGLIITLTIAASAAFGLFIVMLGLALGSAERGMTLARLTVMGHERPAGLVITEAMPAVLTAVVAGVACALALPRAIGSAIDLSAFTGTSTPIQFEPDALALGLPAAAIIVLALAALAVEARAVRRRDVSGMLRAH
jgi:putative ABC transport system permease protein